MEVTQDVIVDLLPVYFSGDASASTRALVDDFLSRDAAFADRVQREWAAPLGTGPAVQLPPDAKLRSLQRTRRLLVVQRWLFGLAMVCSALPLSMEIQFSGGRLTEFHFLLRDHPGALVPFVIAAAICWAAYLSVGRRLRVTP